MSEDPNTKELKEGQLQKFLVILDVLRSVQPAPMDFRNFFREEDLAEEEKSGIIHLLIYNNYLTPSALPNHYSISAEGLKFIARVPMGSLNKAICKWDTAAPAEKDETDNLMISIQPSSWPHGNEALSMQIISDFGRLKNDIPLVTFGVDDPEKFSNLPLTEKNKELIPSLLELAQRNLQKINVRVQHDGESNLIVVDGHYFASEKILDPLFMNELHKKLNSDTLVVSIPKKGCMFVTKMFSNNAEMEGFKLITEMKYNEQSDRYSISKSLFMIVEGKFHAIMNPEFDTP